jgi:hypothetical protein
MVMVHLFAESFRSNVLIYCFFEFRFWFINLFVFGPFLILSILNLKFVIMESHQNCSVMGNNYMATLVGMLNNSKNNPKFEKVLS